MAEKTLRRAAFGYVVGMPIGTIILIVLSFATQGGAHLFTDALLARTGSEAGALLMQTVLSGIIGAVGVGGTSLFDIEGWSLFRSATVYYATYTITFMPIGFFLGWIESVSDALVMAEVFAIVVLVATLAITARYKMQVEQLNALLENAGQSE